VFYRIIIFLMCVSVKFSTNNVYRGLYLLRYVPRSIYSFMYTKFKFFGGQDFTSVWKNQWSCRNLFLWRQKFPSKVTAFMQPSWNIGIEYYRNTHSLTEAVFTPGRILRLQLFLLKYRKEEKVSCVIPVSALRFSEHCVPLHRQVSSNWAFTSLPLQFAVWTDN
jgi:hypothetical protein